MLLELPFSFWKKIFFVEFNIWERTRKFQFWKRRKDYIIAMENLKKKCLLEEKKGWLWKFYGEIIPKELMFQRFTSVFDSYACFYVIMYSISMDSAYKPFHCKAAADYFFFFSRCQCFMITKSLVLSESIFVYLRYWNKNSDSRASTQWSSGEQGRNWTGREKNII